MLHFQQIFLAWSRADEKKPALGGLEMKNPPRWEGYLGRLKLLASNFHDCICAFLEFRPGDCGVILGEAHELHFGFRIVP